MFTFSLFWRDFAFQNNVFRSIHSPSKSDMDDEDYAAIRKKPLKIGETAKKKKKRKPHQEIGTIAESGREPLAGVSSESRIIVTAATKAEQAFKAKQDSIAQARILKKASKTHKQRVEEFNKHLNSLSEHYDIPKVSWTK